MYDPHHLVDSLESGSGRFGGDGTDPRSWLSGDAHSPPPASSFHRRADSSFSAASVAAAANVDPTIVNELVEMFPLVQYLIDQKQNTSFTRRGSVIYTKTPSRESLYKKAPGAKGRNTTQSISRKKKKENVGEDLSLRSSIAEKEREELLALRDQVEDLQKKLLEKDELLKEVENSKIEIASLHSKLDGIQKEFDEKDSLLRSTQIQLSDAKIKLADKQAAVEKLEWEATTSTKKAEKLQRNLDVVQDEISLFMKFVGELTKNKMTHTEDDYHVSCPWDDQLNEMDNLKEVEMQKVEAARETYVAALAAAKEKRDESSMAAASAARKQLQSLLGLF
ncbi:unnamed protein product [Cuscuta europaea]|uniref:Uncharacterized protein n=1 Tax=Cuscuta europaea TaxID=41803 RepID=A0A9P1E427_CUSEU|nr:unnamed protein product [Cuscuta europaea]